MLEKQDLQAIQTMIDTSVNSAIAASEDRMSAKIDAAVNASEDRMSAKIDAAIAASEDRMSARIDAAVAASEERMTAKMDSLEDRMSAKIEATENRILAYIENAVMPNFKLLAEGQQTLLQTMARKDRVEALENEVVFLKSVVKNLAQDVAELKKAQ